MNRFGQVVLLNPALRHNGPVDCKSFPNFILPQETCPQVEGKAGQTKLSIWSLRESLDQDNKVHHGQINRPVWELRDGRRRKTENFSELLLRLGSTIRSSRRRALLRNLTESPLDSMQPNGDTWPRGCIKVLQTTLSPVPCFPNDSFANLAPVCCDASCVVRLSRLRLAGPSRH